MTEQVLAALVAFFVLWLVVRMVWSLVSSRGIALPGNGPETPEDSELSRLVDEAKASRAKDGIRLITRRAQGLPSSTARAAHLCAAGDLALAELKRPGLAGGLYLRALREDPTCIDALNHLRQILVAQKRLRRLERAYWDVLARLEDPEANGDVWVLCWQGLASLYAASPRTVRRADAIRKALDVFGVLEEDESLNEA